MNGHQRPTVDDAAWFDLQIRCLEQLRALLQYLDSDNHRTSVDTQVKARAQNTLNVLLTAIDTNARKT